MITVKQINHGKVTRRFKNEDSTDSTCNLATGDPWDVKQHHLKSEEKENLQLIPSGPRNGRKSWVSN